ncbi:hypothetical protein KUTeg_013876 [Tegillarca granosa]|uniref:VWFA domain-containing protein n=1 Tax=Tegillarca granosa TaxID=220873 RepID=A0ABQ9EYC7_TEGGR|nr:hypothetical protein KUTeg_013876 [Tegillarca granosa]
MSEVEDEVMREIETCKRNDEKEEAAISQRIIDKLDLKRAISNKLTRNNEALSTATEFAKVLASFKNMADVKKALTRPYRPTPGRTDTYEVRQGRISYEQARRMPELAKHDGSVLDLAFVMDCTGSMGEYIKTAQNNIRKIVEEIVSSEKSDVQLSLIEYRDHPPQDSTFVTRTHDFTNSVSKMRSWLENCSADGGGDTPEAVADGLHELLKLNWRSESTKIGVLIADAPPHGLSAPGDGFSNGCPAGIDPMETIQKLAEKGITLYSVGCEPAISPYKEFFMAIAYMTGGQYVPLTGAGLLTKVIIGGAQEELSLEQWMADVDQEVQADLQAGREIDDEEISRRVQEKLNLKGAKAKQLQRNNATLEAPTENALKLSKFNNMADVRKNFVLGAPSMMASYMPCMARRREEQSDVYDVVENEMSYSQVSRMVQKSKARNMAMFKKN